jgi:hypothetical protein
MMARTGEKKSDSRRLFSFLRGAENSECHSMPVAAGGGTCRENVRGENLAA